MILIEMHSYVLIGTFFAIVLLFLHSILIFCPRNFCKISNFAVSDMEHHLRTFFLQYIPFLREMEIKCVFGRELHRKERF